MALQTQVQTFEAERLVGARSAQALVRAEALVPGAGRDAIEPLLADAGLDCRYVVLLLHGLEVRNSVRSVPLSKEWICSVAGYCCHDNYSN